MLSWAQAIDLYWAISILGRKDKTWACCQTLDSNWEREFETLPQQAWWSGRVLPCGVKKDQQNLLNPAKPHQREWGTGAPWQPSCQKPVESLRCGYQIKTAVWTDEGLVCCCACWEMCMLRRRTGLRRQILATTNVQTFANRQTALMRSDAGRSDGCIWGVCWMCKVTWTHWDLFSHTFFYTSRTKQNRHIKINV